MHRSDLKEKTAKAKLRMTRGEGYFYWAYRPLALATFLKIWDLPIIFIGLIVSVWMAFMFLVGYVDEKHFKIWQFENEYASDTLNPVLKKIMKNQNKIMARLENYDQRN